MKIECRIVKKFGLCANCDTAHDPSPCASAKTVLEELEKLKKLENANKYK